MHSADRNSDFLIANQKIKQKERTSRFFLNPSLFLTQQFSPSKPVFPRNFEEMDKTLSYLKNIYEKKILSKPKFLNNQKMLTKLSFINLKKCLTPQ